MRLTEFYKHVFKDKTTKKNLLTFSHLADNFIQSDLQMRTMEAIKINKRAMICKCYNKSQFFFKKTSSY